MASGLFLIITYSICIGLLFGPVIIAQVLFWVAQTLIEGYEHAFAQRACYGASDDQDALWIVALAIPAAVLSTYLLITWLFKQRRKPRMVLAVSLAAFAVFATFLGYAEYRFRETACSTVG
jgi:hypothetical protein